MQDCCRTPYGVRGFKLRPGVIYILDTEVALRMECVDLSGSYTDFFQKSDCRTPYGVRGFKLTSGSTVYRAGQSHSVWSAWI